MPKSDVNEMTTATREQLIKFVKQAEHVVDHHMRIVWEARVLSFLHTALGPVAAKRLPRGAFLDWANQLAKQVGHLEGIIAKSAHAKENEGDNAELRSGRQSTKIDIRKVFVVHGQSMSRE